MLIPGTAIFNYIILISYGNLHTRITAVKSVDHWPLTVNKIESGQRKPRKKKKRKKKEMP